MKVVSINYSNIVCGIYPVSIKTCVNYIAMLLSDCPVYCVLTTPSTVPRIWTEHIPVFASVCTSPKYVYWVCYFSFARISFSGRDMRFFYSPESQDRLWVSSLHRAFRKITSTINQQMHVYNFHLKHLKPLRPVSIFSDHHQGVSSFLAKVITYSRFSSFL